MTFLKGLLFEHHRYTLVFTVFLYCAFFLHTKPLLPVGNIFESPKNVGSGRSKVWTYQLCFLNMIYHSHVSFSFFWLREYALRESSVTAICCWETAQMCVEDRQFEALCYLFSEHVCMELHIHNSNASGSQLPEHPC